METRTMNKLTAIIIVLVIVLTSATATFAQDIPIDPPVDMTVVDPNALEDTDKLGNFEIQDLMSRFNQAETLASSVQKKQDDTSNAVIGKVG
jgi:hypothetical protein